MRLQRTLAPTAAPISLCHLFASLKGLLGGTRHRDRLVGELQAKFSAHGVFLVSSGKAALTVILKALAATSTRRRVVIPAYTCFSVPSAIVKTGLEVVLCDVDPDTLDFRFAELEKLLDEGVLCVLPTHLFGQPADVDRVKRLCERTGTIVVEDAAQAWGGRSGRRLLGTLGEVAFFSMGRGKNLTCGSGGIILSRSTAISDALRREYSTLSDPPPGDIVRNWIEMAMMRLFIHPTLYWLPAGLPFLRLGETKFYTEFPIYRMDEVRACQLQDWDERVNRANRKRMERATWLIDGLDLPAKGVKPITDSDAVYLRLPVLVRDRETKDAVCRRSRESGAGVSPNYPTTIQEIPALIGRILNRPCPGAQEIVDRLVTLPTHEFVKEPDRRKLDRILGHPAPNVVSLSRTARSSDSVSGERSVSSSIK